ncbi:Hypothetical predicted protein [Pelobates cultripes]|uniref:Uncharacterized protein n=1 Tax=Pelobates cultripes TaxID=61616 RepID=A0AAD1S4W2_PELCU|nr:Hypothetical predicted protein [Pelobates cultripes]
MNNIRASFNADLYIIREDVAGVLARVKATEEQVSSMAHQKDGSKEQIQLQAAHRAVQIKLDTLEDIRRHNLKMRGIAETVYE